MLNGSVGFPVTPSNTVDLPKATRALYVGVSGDVKVNFGNRIGMGRVTAVDSTGAITAIQIENAGMGYNSAPTATVTDTNTDPGAVVGSGASITVTVANGRVSAFTINSGGSGYHVYAEVTLAGGFTGVVLTGLAQGIVHDLQVTRIFATGTTATNIVGFY